MLRQLTIKFLHRVRIHGGEFDSSARAMNRVEESNFFQADLRKFRGSTFERKQMSTTIKRIALVAVAALGLGVVSVAPSQATVSAHQLTLSSATSTQLTDETSTASAAVATVSFLNSGAGDTVSVTAYLMSAPAGNTVTPVIQVSETSSAAVDDTAVLSGALGAGAEITSQVAYISGTASPAAVTAKFKVYMNSATKAGTYVVKLVPAVVAGGGVIDTTGVTLTITVSTNPATDTVAASATSILTSAADTTTATDATVTADKTASQSAEVAYIKVTLKNAAGVTTTGESYTAIIKSGPGLLGSNTLTNSYTDANLGRAISVKAGDVVAVYPDGASGVSTISIQSKAGVELATESLTFYGDVASVDAKVVKAVINASSGQNAILVNLKDAAGTAVTKATTFYVTSSDTTKISGSYASTGSISYDAKNGTLGAGFLIPITGVAAGTANVTVGTKASATATTGVNAAAVSIRVGSATADSLKVTFDKASYAPGEKATITVALFDATGLAVADGNYTGIFATGGITSTYTMGGGSDTTTAVDLSGAYAIADGVKTYTVYMPVTEGDVKFSWTSGAGYATVANRAVAGSVTVAVSSASTSAAIDAANEASQAASDATDAALAAADAADEATTKAQEAVDAVATLSAEVTKMINALKAQIRTLSNLVTKIAKKVRA